MRILIGFFGEGRVLELRRRWSSLPPIARRQPTRRRAYEEDLIIAQRCPSVACLSFDTPVLRVVYKIDTCIILPLNVESRGYVDTGFDFDIERLERRLARLGVQPLPEGDPPQSREVSLEIENTLSLTAEVLFSGIGTPGNFMAEGPLTWALETPGWRLRGEEGPPGSPEMAF